MRKTYLKLFKHLFLFIPFDKLKNLKNYCLSLIYNLLCNRLIFNNTQIMKRLQKIFSILLLFSFFFQNITAFGATRAEPLFNKADYLPNDTEAQIEVNSMRWFEERVKFVKENIKMLPDDFMEDWNWNKPLTRMEFLVLMTPMRADAEMFNDMPIARQSTYIDLIPNEDNGYVHYWIKEQNTNKPILMTYNNVGWNSKEGIRFFIGDKTLNKYQYRYWYVYSSKQSIFKGTNGWDNNLINIYKSDMKNKLWEGLPNSFSREQYENFRNNFGIEAELGILGEGFDYFYPDRPLNLAEAVTATARSVWKYNREEKVSGDTRYQVSENYIKSINGIPFDNKLTSADVLTTKQMARMMFMALMNNVKQPTHKNYYKEDLYLAIFQSWGPLALNCNSKKLKQKHKRIFDFYCTELVN